MPDVYQEYDASFVGVVARLRTRVDSRERERILVYLDISHGRGNALQKRLVLVLYFFFFFKTPRARVVVEGVVEDEGVAGELRLGVVWLRGVADAQQAETHEREVEAEAMVRGTAVRDESRAWRLRFR